MSNKTQLATNNTQLASLIQTLQGKATGGGGGGVETCTLNINASGIRNMKYTTVDDNGKITTVIGNSIAETNKSIKCVIGTIVYFYNDGGPGATASTSGCEVLTLQSSAMSCYLLLTCCAGETASITIGM